MINGVVECLGIMFGSVSDTTYIGVWGSMATSLVCEVILNYVFSKLYYY